MPVHYLYRRGVSHQIENSKGELVGAAFLLYSLHGMELDYEIKPIDSSVRLQKRQMCFTRRATRYVITHEVYQRGSCVGYAACYMHAGQNLPSVKFFPLTKGDGWRVFIPV